MVPAQNELGGRGPALIRRDCAHGNEDIIDICEERGPPYLPQLRKTNNVKRLIERLFKREEWGRSSEATQGWADHQRQHSLERPEQARRVLVLRRRIKQDISMTAKRDDRRPYWYVRAANSRARREALTSRPVLLAGVGPATSYSDQTTLYLKPMHAETGLNKFDDL